MKKIFSKTKSGVASLYVVIFATILFGVITLSFIRIMVSESSQTNDSDLSQSAYDAALAGVEDAKIAVNDYYECKKNGGKCNDSLFAEDCSALNNYLYQHDGEVPIRELQDSETSTNQAYTCVIISNVTSDYRARLNDDSRVKVIPIAVDDNAQEIGSIVFSWYSDVNGTKFENLDNKGLLRPADRATIPPTIALGLISVGSVIDLKTIGERDSPTFSKIVAVPSDEGGNGQISSADLINAASAERENNTTQVKCAPAGVDREFACQVTLNVSGIAQPNGNMYLVASMPYGEHETDFMVQLLNTSGEVIEFKDVQVSVDSTGRAHDLYRRVETRLSPSNQLYPYPQFELTITGNDEGSGKEALSKDFWVTLNCWGTDCNNNNLQGKDS